MKFLRENGSKGKLWRKTVEVCIFIALVMFVGCNGGGGSSSSDSPPLPLTGQLLADTVVDQWLGIDFSFQNPNGTDDSDSDGEIDTNDAVDFVESINSLGYDIPETLVDGLYNNYYTADGYDDDGTSPEIDFTYTVDNPITQADLMAQDWSGLEVGDLIFVDYDKDFEWDFAAVYLGASSGFTHAVVFASDWYDKVVIEDLDNNASIIILDINFGYSDVRTPAYDIISDS